MKKMTVLCAAAIVALSTQSIAAELKSLSKDDVTKLFRDRTISTTPFAALNDQLINNTLTVYFAKNGTVTGEFTNKPENDPTTDKGIWRMSESGALCTTWEKWNHGKPNCFFVYKVGNGLVFINSETHTFANMVPNEFILIGNQMNGTSLASK